MVRHSAFTMIELIFAIVIIAISVLSLPMVNQVIAKNSEGSLAQEAIFAASAELNQAVTYRWDENSLDANTSLSRVVWSSTTDCNSTTKLRPGHILQPYHRRCSDNNFSIAPPSSLGPDGGDLDDLDDINTSARSLYINSAGTTEGSITGYKKIYNSTFSISYASFGTITAASNNIKRINVTITDPDSGATITSLTAFSSNIGEIDYYKRSY